MLTHKIRTDGWIHSKIIRVAPMPSSCAVSLGPTMQLLDSGGTDMNYFKFKDVGYINQRQPLTTISH